MKKFWVAAVLAVLLGAGTGMTAEIIPTVRIKEKTHILYQKGKDSIPVTTYLMVPLRETAEWLGFSVTEKDGRVFLDDGKSQASMEIGTDFYSASYRDANGSTVSGSFSLGIPSCEKDGVAFVPVSLFHVLLGNQPGSVSVSPYGLSIFFTRTDSETQEEPSVGMPNPFHDYATVSEMEKFAGFSMTFPDIKNAKIMYRAIPGELAEVIYRRRGEEFLRIRKGKGENVSGDYDRNIFAKIMMIKGTKVIMEGNGGGMHVAIWKKGGFSYAILAAREISIDEMTEYMKKTR